MKIPPGEIPDPLDDTTRRRFDVAPDLRFRFDVDDAVMTWWRDALGPAGLYPRELAVALAGRTDHRCEFEYTACDPDKGHLRLESKGFDGDVPAFFSGRSLEFDRRVVHLDKTSIQDGYKGEGTGSILLANALFVADRLAFARLELLAAMDGTYVWARAGFLIDDKTWGPEYAERLRAPIRERLYAIPRRDLDEAKRDLLLSLVDQGRDTMLWDLVDVAGSTTSVKTPHDRVPLGRALLAETDASWYGFMPTAPGEARRRLEDYLRKKAAIG